MSIVETVGVRIPRRWLRPLVYGLSAVGLGLGFVVVATRDPAATALLVVAPAPALGLAASAPALFETSQRGRLGRGFNPLVGGGAAGVAWAATVGPHLLGLQAPLIGAAAGALAGLALALAGVLRGAKLAAPIQYAVMLAVLCALYGGGALTLINVRFDAGRSQVFRTMIAGKYVSHGKSTSYNLELLPWGPQTERSSIGVASSLYDAVQVGDPICATLHPGALGSAWYELARCAPAAAEGAGS